MAGEARIGMPPFIIFEGKLCSPDNIFISGEQELLIKIKGGGGHTEALITFLLLYFVCYVEYPKADFSRATLPAPVLERLNSIATVPTVETTTLKTVSVAVTTGGPSPTKETTQPLQTEQATTQVPHSIIFFAGTVRKNI